MNEIEFRKWLSEKGLQKKTMGDTISRLKRIERELCDGDIDVLYKKDQCEDLLRIVSKHNINQEIEKSDVPPLPFGKNSIDPHRYAIKKYITFLEEKEATK